ncbi:hypothetical protein EC973_008005 [Apophysomyces ossiformis]|uniref:RGS domain-containing protein n=1 Tax=Apophysomyces ossiformis TaxID=679940 RepID=A0A8H7BP14_9FUNG|nr:hypothetical protein EC973_008005 [Apophysomyces ossiformis]
MQIERSPSSVSSGKNKRRPSHINLTPNSAGQDILAPRTPKSISKSRRSSVVQELVDSSRPSSRRSSHANGSNGNPLTPVLLSDSANTYFKDMTENEAVDHASGDDASSLSSSYSRPRSSSITSILSATGISVGPSLPNFDVHTLYKIKMTRSSRKLDNFFGEQAPHDICVKEIRKEGLKAMLESKIPLCYFLYHLLEEYSSENLFFFIELEQYQSFSYTSLVQQMATAQHIYNTYLTRNSHLEVNLDDKVRRMVTDALQKKQVDTCFESAKRAVYNLLETSFLRFLQTKTFERMVDECGELTTHYTNKVREAAVNQLLAYLEQQHAMIYTNPHTDSPVFGGVSQTTRKRQELVKSMIHEFCRTFLGVEFNYYRPSPSAQSVVVEEPARQNAHHSNNKRDVFEFFGKKKQ